MKLNKTLYGLKQAAYEYFLVWLQAGQEISHNQSRADPCVFYRRTEHGTDTNNMWLAFHEFNGERLAHQFLGILGWFLEWESEAQSLRQPSKFIAPETLKADKYVCLGFSCMIRLECVQGTHQISPSKINQDICEHHFANVRRYCQSHANPTETECMAGVLKSSWFRMEYIRKGNCGALTNDSSSTVLERTSHHLRRQGYGKLKQQKK